MTKKSQTDKFKDAARSIRTDNSEKRFNEKLGKIARKKPSDLPKKKKR